MSRHLTHIQSYVESLLRNDLNPVKLADQYVTYGYKGEREVYSDPSLPDHQVVVARSQYDANRNLITDQPDVIQEALNYIEGLRKSANELINNEINSSNKALKIKAINQIAASFKSSIPKEFTEHTKADLFSKKGSDTNKKFLKTFDKVTEKLKLFTQMVVTKSGHNVKDLEHEGHLLRSKNRATQVHRFKAEGPKNADSVKKDEERFIMYIPCGRYTTRQQALMGNADSVDRDHDTTSHNRKNLVLGNSSMARMIVGTRHADGKATIHHDSFTGPGARMPYADFSGADEYKKLAIKAITLINQEEIIQTLAQRQIDRMTNAELWDGIKNKSYENVSSESPRSILIPLYLQTNNLSVTECYSQVISAGQKISSEHQKEQFEYVRQVMDAFDGSTATVTIQTDNEHEIGVGVGYQARMSSWGVNWFRHDGALNPTTSINVAKAQNTRFINQMTNDVVADLRGLTESNFIAEIFCGPDVTGWNEKIEDFETQKKNHKSCYRNALFDYYEHYLEYTKGNVRDTKTLDEYKRSIAQSEKTLNDYDVTINRLHSHIELQRSNFFICNKQAIQTALGTLRQEVSTQISDKTIDESTKVKLQHIYNSSAYLIQAQELYYEDTWHEAKNNFKLQTYTSLLAEELDYANTKGCKSNNDRGQRLAQKIAGNALWTAMSEDGLHTGEFLNHRRTKGDNVHLVEKLDRELTTIQTLHHTANTGVSGGKFDIQDKQNFADNGLWGKIARFAKLKDMLPESVWTKHFALKVGFGVALGLVIAAVVAVLLVFLGPVGGLIVGLGATASTSIVSGVVFAATAGATYLAGTAIAHTINRADEYNVISSLEEEYKPIFQQYEGKKTEEHNQLQQDVDENRNVPYIEVNVDSSDDEVDNKKPEGSEVEHHDSSPRMFG